MPTQSDHVSNNQKGQPPLSQDRNGEAGTVKSSKVSSSLTGTVIDAYTKNPLPGVLISVPGQNGEGAVTDANGAFTIQTHVSDGEMFWLRATREGYVPKQAMYQSGSQDAEIRLTKNKN